MQKTPVFLVHCMRKNKTKWYYVGYSINDQLSERIKEFPRETRQWNDDMKCWELQTLQLYQLILKYRGSDKIYFNFGDDERKKVFLEILKKEKIKEDERLRLLSILNEKKKHWVKYKEELEQTYEKYTDLVHKNLKPEIKLYPHQIVGVMFFNEIRRGLLALDMGTGKSLISIAFVELNKFEKVFVITPNSLKFNYYYEVAKFTNSKANIINWKKNPYSIEESKYIIVNYDYFRSKDIKATIKKFNSLNIGKIDCLICDESHRLSSSKTNTYKAFSRIFNDNIFKDKKNISKIFMSGTPATSRILQLYTQLNQISPLEFARKSDFLEYYCGITWDVDEGLIQDYSMTKYEELFHKLSPFTYRKKKNEVLKDLPEKIYQKIYLEMNVKEYFTYMQIERGIANEFLEKTVTNPLAILGKLREYTSSLKVNGLDELIQSIINSGEKIVIVDFFKNSLVELNNKYKNNSVLHTGDFKEDLRAQMVVDFQNENSNIDIFLGSESTTKEGLTLTAASKIGVSTIPWTPGTLDQIVDRCCRIGQKNAVNAYLFMFKDTIDEYVFDLIENKRNEISQVLDNEEHVANYDETIISDLIELIKNKHKK